MWRTRIKQKPAAFEKQGMDGQEAQGLSDVIEYAARQEKTGRIAPDEEGAPVMQRFVSGVNCSPYYCPRRDDGGEKAVGKEDGTMAYQSWRTASAATGSRASATSTSPGSTT